MQNLTDSGAEYLTMRQACRIIPGRPHIATIWRWQSPRGVRGQRLSSWVIGGQRFTTREAVEEFLAKLNSDCATPTPSSTPKQRERAIERAEKELADMGL